MEQQYLELPLEEVSENNESLTVEEAIANLRHEELGKRYYAAWWLGRFRVNIPAAIEGLIAALEDDSDRTEDGGYPLRRNAARALGKLEDKKAVPALIKCLESSDYYVRDCLSRSIRNLPGESIAAFPHGNQRSDGVALAADRLGTRAIIVMPRYYPSTKSSMPYKDIIEAWGSYFVWRNLRRIPSSYAFYRTSEAEKGLTFILPL